eukprot:10175-Chlamydomonas_euryale.AAC.11
MPNCACVCTGRAMELLLKQICEKTYAVAAGRSAKTISASHIAGRGMGQGEEGGRQQLLRKPPWLHGCMEAATKQSASVQRRAHAVGPLGASVHAHTWYTWSGFGARSLPCVLCPGARHACMHAWAGHPDVRMRACHACIFMV